MMPWLLLDHYDILDFVRCIRRNRKKFKSIAKH